MSFDKIHPVQTEEKLKNANHFYNRVTDANIDYFHYWQEEHFYIGIFGFQQDLPLYLG